MFLDKLRDPSAAGEVQQLGALEYVLRSKNYQCNIVNFQ